MSTISAHHHRLIQDLDDWDGEEPLGKWMETLGRIVGNMPGGDWLERFCDDKLGRTAAITVEVKEIMEDGDFRRPTAVEPRSPLHFGKVEEWDTDQQEDRIKAEPGVPRTPARTEWGENRDGTSEVSYGGQGPDEAEGCHASSEHLAKASHLPG